ncbi:MAG: FG-GAP repeat protein [Xanthomonadales bacterium]|nr:FG-GAP repeat protein [Xanthomonadales bacterium]
MLPAVAALSAVAHAQPAADLVRSYTGCCNMGWGVADVADLDGDGRRDFVAGAPNGGQVVAYSTQSATPLWTATPGIGSFGWSIGDAGDRDGDLRSEIIAGAPNAASGGAARVLSGLDGQVSLVLPRPSGASQYGYAVSSLPDLNGDLIGELLVGAPGGNGAVYVQSGSDGSVLRTQTGTAGSQFGSGVSSIADIDGDEIRDYVVGAPNDGPGRAYVYSGASGALLHTLSAQSAGSRFGDFFVADAGDVDADGTTDIYVGAYNETGANGAAYVFSGATGLRIHRIAGTTGEGLGPGRSAGDVDGDGHADIIVGAYTYGGGGVSQGGRIGIFSGADLSFLTRMNGTRPGGQFGFDAVGLGDVTGDGRLDFIVASSPASTVDLFAGVVNAQATTGGLQFKFPIKPAVGGWISPTSNFGGISFDLNFDVDRPVANGEWQFQENGAARVVFFQGDLIYSSQEQLVQTGIFATLDSPTFTFTGRSDYSNPVVGTNGTPVFTGRNIRIEFRSPRDGTFIDNPGQPDQRSHHIVGTLRGLPLVAPVDYSGDWVLIGSRDSASQHDEAVVRVALSSLAAPSGFRVVDASGSAAPFGIATPQAGARLYRLQCVDADVGGCQLLTEVLLSRCGTSCVAGTETMLLWINPDETGRLGSVTREANGTIVLYDLGIPDTLAFGDTDRINLRRKESTAVFEFQIVRAPVAPAQQQAHE